MLLRLSILILCIGFFMTAGSMGSVTASEAMLPQAEVEEKAELEEPTGENADREEPIDPEE